MSPEADSYQSWMERMMGGREARPLETEEVIKTSAGEPFAPIEFAKTERELYHAEIGKKMGDYVYHFFPLPSHPQGPGLDFPTHFEEKMGEAFLQVFQFEERIEAVFSPELHSWAVRAKGFATNPMSDELALSLFSVLDQKWE